MQEPEVYERLAKSFREVFGEDIKLRPDLTSADVDGWDSFAHINLILAIEAEFGIRVSTADVERLKSVGELVALILRQVQ